jgi:hypothetical protein
MRQRLDDECFNIILVDIGISRHERETLDDMVTACARDLLPGARKK